MHINCHENLGSTGKFFVPGNINCSHSISSKTYSAWQSISPLFYGEATLLKLIRTLNGSGGLSSNLYRWTLVSMWTFTEPMDKILYKRESIPDCCQSSSDLNKLSTVGTTHMVWEFPVRVITVTIRSERDSFVFSKLLLTPQGALLSLNAVQSTNGYSYNSFVTKIFVTACTTLYVVEDGRTRSRLRVSRTRNIVTSQLEMIFALTAHIW